jgi:hypothetical protein
MSVVNGYCSVAELRNHLRDDGTKLNDSSLEKAISAASRAIDDHCDRTFWLDSGVAERTYVVTDRQVAFVDDIGSRTGLVVKTGTDGATFPTTLTVGTDFILEPRNADKFAGATGPAFAFWQIRLIGYRVFLGAGYPWPTLSVTARHGWSAVPDEVNQACILKAAALFKRKDAPFGIAGVNDFGPVRITRADPDVIDMLATYAPSGFA